MAKRRSYTYHIVEGIEPPFKKRIKRTFGRYIKTTDPCGAFGFRYAIFRNKSSELWIPTHDLTLETKERLEREQI